MGLGSVLGRQEAVSSGGSQRLKFGKYFPRLFAYVQSAVRDETRAQEMVAQAFAETFAGDDFSDDEEFRIWLFAHARRIVHAGLGATETDGLTGREREVISLLFDAQLTRREVGILLSVSEDVVASTLLKGLRRLRETRKAHSTPFFLRAS
jgi:DNA-directed RNA polymerase specialized sigma24 family protein